MTLKGMINRRLVLAMIGPAARAVMSAGVGYLVSKGVPADQVEQLSIAVASVGVIGFNITWSLVETRKASQKAVSNFIEGHRQ